MYACMHVCMYAYTDVVLRMVGPGRVPAPRSNIRKREKGLPINVARFSMFTSIVVAAEWPDSAFSLLSWWPQSGPVQHVHFYRGGRGVALVSILTSIGVAAEWHESPDLHIKRRITINGESQGTH